MDIAELRTQEGKLSWCVAIDRTCQLAAAKLHAEANTRIAAPFLRHVLAALPATIHTVLTDHGSPGPNRKRDRYAFPQIFDRVGHEPGIDQRRTKTPHPWTNGQVERLHRRLKEATVQTDS
jgi:hypothetical protein